MKCSERTTRLYFQSKKILCIRHIFGRLGRGWGAGNEDFKVTRYSILTQKFPHVL